MTTPREIIRRMSTFDPERRSLDIGPGDIPWQGSSDFIDIEDERDNWPDTIGEEEAEELIRKSNFIIGSAEDLPYEDNTFEFINANQVFGRYADLEPSLREAVRVTRPGGMLRIRILGVDKRDTLKAFKRMNVRIIDIERQGYNEKVSEDDFDILAQKGR